MRICLWLCYGLIGWACFPAHAVIIRDDRLDADALAAGALFQSVGMLEIGERGFGSGTMIHPEWMLTAGHCIYDDNGELYGDYFVQIGGERIQADRFVVHEDYNYTDPGGWDIALVHLTSPVTGVPISPLYTGSLTLGTEVALAGFGYYGTGLTGAEGFDGLRRAAWNIVDGVGGEDVPFDVGGESYNLSYAPVSQFFIDFDEPGQGNGLLGGPALDFEGNSAPGDSGGGWFVEEDGVYYLTGITSGGYVDGAGYGDLSYNVNTTVFNEWIQQAIPEPSVASILFVGAGIFFIRRRIF